MMMVFSDDDDGSGKQICWQDINRGHRVREKLHQNICQRPYRQNSFVCVRGR
uniref:Uncharacterized protein n=1 Tax=Arundo donax TaxID=35708 RepID=A0A0A9E201_ARUDO